MIDITVTVRLERRLKMPTLPNFIRDAATDEPVDIADLTEDQLREIGKAWTDALVRKARERVDVMVRDVNRKLAQVEPGPEAE